MECAEAFLHSALQTGPTSPSPYDDDDDDDLVQFLESEVLSLDEIPCSATSDWNDAEAEEPDPKVPGEEIPAMQKRLGEAGDSRKVHSTPGMDTANVGKVHYIHGIDTGHFGKIPPELFPNILKFLSSEDLSMCAGVCQFLRFVTSDESLWRRLYCLRWGPPSQTDRPGKPRGSAWKKLYFERDQSDMVEFVRNTPVEFREYYIQMQAAKRSQAPAPALISDDLVVIDTSVADHVTAWRRGQKLPDVYLGDHWCSGRTCSYHQIGDIFLCEKTGRAHVCDDTCRETVLDPSNELLVCTVSGRCFDRWLDGDDEDDETQPSRQQAENNAATEEGEPFMGAGRLGRAYLLGYNCLDERELDAALREVVYPRAKKLKLYPTCACD